MDESAEPVVSFEVTYGGDAVIATDRCWWDEVQRAVRSVRVVVIDVDAEDVLEVAAVEDEEPVEAFSANGADEEHGDRVLSRSQIRKRKRDSGAAGEVDAATAELDDEEKRLVC